MRKILIGICMVFLGVIIMYFNDGFKIIDNDGFKIIDEVVKSEDILPIQNILVEDFVCPSVSTAATLVRGSSSNGWECWKTSEGESINIFRKNNI